MSLIRLNRNPSRGQLRLFGLLALAALGAVGGVAWSRGHPAAAAAEWGAGVAIAGLGAVVPPGLRPLYLALAYTTYPIGFVTSYLILGVAYFLVLTPVGLIMRLVGHDPLARRFAPGCSTYWKPRGAPRAARSYLRQS